MPKRKPKGDIYLAYDQRLRLHEDAQTQARAFADAVMPEVLGVFNLAGSRDWEFPPDVKNRAMALCKELCHLFSVNEDKITPTKSAIAQSDVQFQNFMQRAMPKRKPKVIKL